MTLPLLISVPHAGLQIPAEVAQYNCLSDDDIARDGDEGAAEIYGVQKHVRQFATAEVARAFVDLNRAADDRRKDGVIKTHTCWDVPIYSRALPPDLVDTLLIKYYRPYHVRLRSMAAEGVRCGIDCHTMAEHGPPVGPDTAALRPWVCLGNADGTCPQSWIESLAEYFAARLSGPVAINAPFKGGYIVRSHSAELPWIQLELSRASFLDHREKRELVLDVLASWCEHHLM